MTEHTMSISGMTCHHCVMAVQKELSRIPGLQIREVRIGSASVAYADGSVSHEQIRAAVEEAGYHVEEAAT